MNFHALLPFLNAQWYTAIDCFLREAEGCGITIGMLWCECQHMYFGQWHIHTQAYNTAMYMYTTVF